MKPLIGITAGTIYNKERPDSPFTYGQSHTYVEAVTTGGGIPIIIPIMKNPAETKELFDRLDGILFAGGNDISTELYHQQNRDALTIDEPRDSHELALLGMALEARMPVLAICRGMQLLNVLRGGTLHQDILKEVPGAMNHDGNIKEEGEDMVLHTLSLEPDSHLAGVLQTTSIQSNTFHHQAVDQVGQGLTVSAKTHDGIVEGIEDMRNGYIIGVQPHPESLIHAVEPQWNALFESFVDAAGQKKLSDTPDL